MPLKRSILIGICALFISGCAHGPRVSKIPATTLPPSYGQVFTQPIDQVSGFYHTVAKGQTIYSIARNYSVDWHEVMHVNHIANPSALEVGQRLLIPKTYASVIQPTRIAGGPLNYDQIRNLVGPDRARSDWRTITVHHSATRQGSAKAFHRDHTRRHMGGLFYHFVIGNGTSTPDGALEVGFRWKKQKIANRPYDIQICLVGDFNKEDVSESQYSTLFQLIRMLQQDYAIPVSGIRKHEDIRGKHTACPGSRFPFGRMINDLISKSTSPTR